jgi:hypothetical protein
MRALTEARKARNRDRKKPPIAAPSSGKLLVGSIHAWSLPKQGATEDDCEDAYAVEQAGSGGRLLAAVADGATQGFRSASWSSSLVDRFMRRPQGVWDDAWIEPVAVRYRSEFRIQDLPFHAMAKAGNGGFATLLGIQLNPDSGEIRVRAAGDCLLVWAPESGRPLLFPEELADPVAFGTRPVLLASNPDNRLDPAASQQTASMRLTGNGTLLLMTDALAVWFVRSLVDEANPVSQLAELETESSFAAFVERLRNEGSIRDDDTTLIRIPVTSRGI